MQLMNVSYFGMDETVCISMRKKHHHFYSKLLLLK